jgi:hypothetical protein
MRQEGDVWEKTFYFIAGGHVIGRFPSHNKLLTHPCFLQANNKSQPRVLHIA